MYSTTLRVEYDGEIDPIGLDGKPAVVLDRENRAAIRDSGIICAFGEDDYVTQDVIETLFDADYDDMLAIGARVIELERHFNNKRGMDRKDDTLPYELPDFEAALDEYYELRGWNDDGTVPDSQVADYAVADD
jgi:aldehyde:ferredoxin oxidoreductase